MNIRMTATWSGSSAIVSRPCMNSRKVLSDMNWPECWSASANWRMTRYLALMLVKLPIFEKAAHKASQCLFSSDITVAAVPYPTYPTSSLSLRQALDSGADGLLFWSNLLTSSVSTVWWTLSMQSSQRQLSLPERFHQNIAYLAILVMWNLNWRSFFHTWLERIWRISLPNSAKISIATLKTGMLISHCFQR
jgi:hypothetical protein